MSKFRITAALLAMVGALGWYAPGSMLVAAAKPMQAPRPTSYILPGDQVFPEGVAYQRGTNTFFVSSTTDGTIFRGELDNPTTSVFLPGGSDGRTAAVGLKADELGRLFIAGGNTGQLFVYDSRSGELLAKFDNGLDATFVNDVAVSLRENAAYFTDSVSPYLYRVAQNAQGEWTYEVFLDFTGTPFVYQPGFNANGIAATANGRYLIIVQSNTGRLFRVDVATKQVTPIDLGGESVTFGDGILLQGRTLYVVRNQLELIVRIQLSNDLLSGRVVSSTTDPSFAFPTTIARARGRLLVVNSQFDKRGPGLTPDLPFTVSSVPIP